MIPFFDQFIDTREKRYHLLLLLLLLAALIMVVPYVLLGVELIQLHDYNSVFELVKKPSIEWTYISRIIVDAISITTLSFANVVGCLLSNLSALEIIVCLLLVVSYGILETKRMTTIALTLLVVEVISVCVLAIISLNASSLQGVIVNMRIMGVFILLINLALLLLLGYHIKKQGSCYKKALSYVLEEVES